MQVTQVMKGENSLEIDIFYDTAGSHVLEYSWKVNRKFHENR